MIQIISEWVHEWKIKDRRVNILSKEIASLIPNSCTVLDVGCGDGKIAKKVSELKSLKNIHGIDVLIRDNCLIPADSFNGINIPYEANSFDFILLIDVLHHTENQFELLSECKRVARNGIIIKDHINNSRVDYWTLRFMDKVGNSRFDVHLPHLYLSTLKWGEIFNQLSLKVEKQNNRLTLYPFPFKFIFDRELHSLWLLTKHS